MKPNVLSEGVPSCVCSHIRYSLASYNFVASEQDWSYACEIICIIIFVILTFSSIMINTFNHS